MRPWQDLTDMFNDEDIIVEMKKKYYNTYLGITTEDKKTFYGKYVGFTGGNHNFYDKYGVEYRTLSNFWIFSDEGMQWAFDGTQRALEFVASGSVIKPEHHFVIQRCINNNNMDDYHTLKQAYQL